MDCVVAVGEGVEVGGLRAPWPLEVEGLVEGIDEGEVVVLFELVKREAQLLVLFF